MIFLYLCHEGNKYVDIFSVSLEKGEIEKIDQDQFPGMAMKILGMGISPDPRIQRHFMHGQDFEIMMIDTSERGEEE